MRYNYIINPDYQYLKKIIEKIPDIFDREGMLVYDQHHQVRIFKEHDEKIAVKRFHRVKFSKRFRYTFSLPSKAKRAYNYGMKLLEMGISTVTPIAYIEEKKWGLFRRGYLVTAYCADPDARVLRDEWETRGDLIDALVHFLIEMHKKGIMHGNTHLSNFFYREDKNSPYGYYITTLNLHRTRFLDKPTKEDCINNLLNVTYRNHLAEKIVSRYAEMREWNVEESLKMFRKARKMERESYQENSK